MRHKTVITLQQKAEMISIFDLVTQKKYKGLIISTMIAYYISLALTETPKRATTRKQKQNIINNKYNNLKFYDYDNKEKFGKAGTHEHPYRRYFRFRFYSM